MFPLVDAKGNLEVWFNKGVSIPLEGEELPLIINFSSRQNDIAESIMGESWWFPLFESTVVAEASNKINLRLPGGESRILYFSREGNYSTRNGEWQGNIKADRFYVKGQSGWELEYVKGHLRRGSSPRGRKINWDFDGGRPSAIRVDGEEVASIDYSPTGLVSRLFVTAADRKKSVYEFEETKRPIFRSVLGSDLVHDMVPSIRSISNPSGNKIIADAESFLDKGELVVAISEQGFGNWLDKPIQVRVDNESGTLLDDGTYTYRGRFEKKGETFMERRETTSGKAESIYINKSAGVRKWTFLDGSSVEVNFVRLNGHAPARRTVRRNAEGEVVSEIRNFYSSEGEIIRTIETDNLTGEVRRTVRASSDEINALLAEDGSLEGLFVK